MIKVFYFIKLIMASKIIDGREKRERKEKGGEQKRRRAESRRAQRGENGKLKTERQKMEDIKYKL